MSSISRITGSNSGLDVDALVKQALTTYQSKIDKEKQNKQILEYQQEQYRKIMTDSKDFVSKYLDNTKSGSLLLGATYETVSFESDNKSKVTARGFGGASVDDYTVSVTRLASKATTTFSKADLSAQVNQNGTKNGLLYVNLTAETNARDVYVDVAAIEKKESDGTYKDASGTQIYKQTNGKFVKKDSDGNLTDKTGTTRIYKQSDGSFSYNSNGTSKLTDADYATPKYEVDMEQTAINLNKQLSESKLNITAKYSTYSKGIVLESSEKGSSVKFSAMIASTTTAAKDLTTADRNQIVTEANTATDAYGKLKNVYVGTDLQGTITKVGSSDPAYNLSGTSNIVNLDNVQFTLNGVTTSEAKTVPASTTTETETFTEETSDTIPPSPTTKVTTKNGVTTTVTTTVTIVGTTKTTTTDTKIETAATTTSQTDEPVSLRGKADATGLKDKIVKFVDDYNTLIKSINTKIWEDRDTDYKPLTDEQREAMTETQIEKWEAKVKTGLIRKDRDLEKLTTEMRSALSSIVSGIDLEDIGITPVKHDYTTKFGTFSVNEETLTKALEENSGKVKDLFMKAASKTDTTDKGGVLTQLNAVISEQVGSKSSLSKKAGLEGYSTEYTNDITKNIAKKKSLISDLQDKMSAKENSLYKQYSALEKAMEQLNSQQSSLASLLGTS